jgi:hypothetical protein
MGRACGVSITQKRVTITLERIQTLVEDLRPIRCRGLASAAVAR